MEDGILSTFNHPSEKDLALGDWAALPPLVDPVSEMKETARFILQTWPQENMRLQYLRLSQLVLAYNFDERNEH